MAAVVHIRDHNATGLIEFEKMRHSPTRAIPARIIRCASERAMLMKFALSSRRINQEPLHRPSRCFNSP